MSISRSIANVASGRPAPRNGAVGTVLVSAARTVTRGVRNVVDRRRDARGVRQRHIGHGMGADVAGDREAIGEDAAVGGEREAAVEREVAALVIGEERIRAAVGPLHRPAEMAGGERHHHLLAIGIAEQSERPADIAGDDPHPLRRQAEAGRDGRLDAQRALARGVDREQALLGVIGGERRARLHMRRGDALGTERLRDDERRLGAGRLDRRTVAELGLESEIAGDGVMDDGRAGGERRERVGDRGQHLVAHDDALGGVLRRRGGLGDHHRHGLADMAHAISGERRMRRIERRPPPRPDEGAQLDVVGVGGVRHVGDTAAARGRIVVGGDDREHAGQLRRDAGVDAVDAGMGVGRAHEGRIGLAGSRGIVGKAPAAGDEPPVLEARHRPADVRLAPPAAGIRHAFLPRFAFPLTAFRPRLPPGSPPNLFPLASAFF